MDVLDGWVSTPPVQPVIVSCTVHERAFVFQVNFFFISQLVYMQEEVDRILASRNPTDNDLQKLVQKLKHQSDSRSERRSDVSLGSIEGGREGTTCVKAPPISSSVGMAASDSSERRSEITPSRPALPPPSLPPGHQTRIRHVKNDMWAKLSRKDLQDYEKEEQQRRQKAKDRMMQQKHSLDAQIMQQTERKKRDQHDADVVLSTESKKLEQWRAQKDADDRQKRMVCKDFPKNLRLSPPLFRFV